MPDAAASAPRRTASIDGPDPLDIHVGQRLRLRRTMLRRSQDSLARALGVSFQQVQKYERGTNRLGASRLFDVARCLGVPVSFFFEGLDPAALDRRDREVARAPLPAPVDVVPADDPLRDAETIALVTALRRLPPAARAALGVLLAEIRAAPPEARP